MSQFNEIRNPIETLPLIKELFPREVLYIVELDKRDSWLKDMNLWSFFVPDRKSGDINLNRESFLKLLSKEYDRHWIESAIDGNPTPTHCEFKINHMNSIHYYSCHFIKDRKKSYLAFRRVSEQRISETQNYNALQLQSFATLVPGILHDLKTPLQYVVNNLSYLKEVINLSDLSDKDDVLDAVEQSLIGTDKMSKLVHHVLDYRRRGSDIKEDFKIDAILDEAVQITTFEWKKIASVTFSVEPKGMYFFGYPGEIERIVINLIVNSCHAIEKQKSTSKGRISLFAIKETGWNTLIVEDNGCGIPEKNLKLIFNPFYTTKEVGKGTGLGLHLIKEIIEVKHGGEIDVISDEGKGTRITVRLPQNKEVILK